MPASTPAMLLSFASRFFLLQIVHIVRDAVQFVWDVDALRAVRAALITSDAMVGLSQLRHAAVVAYEVSTTGTLVVFVLRVGDDVSLVEALIVVQQQCRDINSIRAGHTVFAVVAGDSVNLHHLGGGLLQEVELIVGQRFQGRVGREVVLQVLHACHTA